MKEKEVLFLRIPQKIKEKLRKEAEKRGLTMQTLIILYLEEKLK